MSFLKFFLVIYNEHVIFLHTRHGEEMKTREAVKRLKRDANRKSENNE